MRVSNLLLALALMLALASGPAAARTRKPPPPPDDDRPVTRAEAAKAIEPLLDAHRTANGRQVTARDVVNLEDVSLHISDETVATEARVERLRREIEELRREIQGLQRRRRRSILP